MIPTDLLHVYLIVLPSVFFAGIVDSIAGGGGLLTVPAYLAAGLPPHHALGTNKFSSTFGTLFTTFRYLKHGLIDIRIALFSAAFALIGSFAGSRTVLILDPGFLRYILLVMFARRDRSLPDEPQARTRESICDDHAKEEGPCSPCWRDLSWVSTTDSSDPEPARF